MASAVFAVFFSLVIVLLLICGGSCSENGAQVCEACGTEVGLALTEDPSLIGPRNCVLDALAWSRCDQIV